MKVEQRGNCCRYTHTTATNWRWKNGVRFDLAAVGRHKGWTIHRSLYECRAFYTIEKKKWWPEEKKRICKWWKNVWTNLKLAKCFKIEKVNNKCCNAGYFLLSLSLFRREFFCNSNIWYWFTTRSVCQNNSSSSTMYLNEWEHKIHDEKVSCIHDGAVCLSKHAIHLNSRKICKWDVEQQQQEKTISEN